jgi:hypothetical protein
MMAAREGRRPPEDGGTRTDVESANVIGELRGHERPDEVVVVGGISTVGRRRRRD